MTAIALRWLHPLVWLVLAVSFLVRGAGTQGAANVLALLGGIPGIALAALAAMALRNSMTNFLPGFSVTPGHCVQIRSYACGVQTAGL